MLRRFTRMRLARSSVGDDRQQHRHQGSTVAIRRNIHGMVVRPELNQFARFQRRQGHELDVYTVLPTRVCCPVGFFSGGVERIRIPRVIQVPADPARRGCTGSC